MASDFRYKLVRGSKKHICPRCSKKRFVRYVDMKTGEELPVHFGRCDRESKCSYHLNPYAEKYAIELDEKNHSNTSNKWIARDTKEKQKTEPVFFNSKAFRQTLKQKGYKTNAFIQNLLIHVKYPFEVEDINRVIDLFKLGTITKGYRKGGVTFPFIDIDDNIRTIQVKTFDQNNNTKRTDFLHSIIDKDYTKNNQRKPKWLNAYLEQDKKVTCLFGEHLLKRFPNNPIALVEAPKTAIYGTLYFGIPKTSEDLIWLAVYNKSSFSFEKLKVLERRFVYVFPDLSKNRITYHDWEIKAKKYENKMYATSFTFSDLLEQLAPKNDKIEGKDLADYLILHDWRKFRKKNKINQPNSVKIELSEQSEASEASEAANKNLILNSSQDFDLAEASFKYYEKSEIQDWCDDIIELENYFEEIKVQTYPIKLNICTTITNCPKFIDSHLEIVKANNGNLRFLPYLERLKSLKKIFDDNI